MTRLSVALAALLALPACRPRGETSPAAKTSVASVDQSPTPAPKPEEPAVSTMPIIRTKADIEPNAGKRVAIEATLRQVPLRKGPASHPATALLLADDTTIWVTYGEPPSGWEASIDKPVTVEATLWNGPPPGQRQALLAPHISDWSEPRLR